MKTHPSTSPSEASAPVPCSAWWDAGWLRCHHRHIGPDMTISHQKFMKIVLRAAKACNRVDDEIHGEQMQNARTETPLLWTCDKCGDHPYRPERERLIGTGCVCGGQYRRVAPDSVTKITMKFTKSLTNLQHHDTNTTNRRRNPTSPKYIRQ